MLRASRAAPGLRASKAAALVQVKENVRKELEDNLSNEVVWYRGVSVLALQEIFNGICNQSLAPGVELYKTLEDLVATNHYGATRDVRKGSTVAVRSGRKVGAVAYIDGYVRFTADQVELKPREDWTIEDVCEQVVLSQTYRESTFYLDILLAETTDDGDERVGAPFAGAFVSQARSCKFGDLVTAIVTYYKSQDRDLATTFVWLDIFSANQPKLVNFGDQSAPADVMQARMDLLSRGLHEAIELFDERLIFFDKWESPTPLTRMWCVWEVYGAVQCHQSLQPIFAPSETKRFIDLMETGSSAAISRVLAGVELATAQCHDEGDRKMIMDAVEKIPGGFYAINGAVLSKVREWLAQTALDILAERREAFGDTSPEAVRLMRNVASLLRDLSQFEAALALFTEVCEIEQSTYGEESLEAAAAEQSLALTHQAKGDYTVALELLEKTLKIRQTLASDDDRKILGTKGCIASVLRRLARYDEALAIYEEISEAEEHMKDDVAYATTLHNMGNVLQSRGGYAAAYAKYEAALEIRQRTLGPKHPLAAMSMHNMAVMLQDQGKYDEALDLYRRVLGIRSEQLGPDHAYTAMTMACIASALHRQEKYSEALEQYQSVLEIQKKRFGPGHENVAVTMYWTSFVLSDLRRFEEALSYAEQSDAYLRVIFPNDATHPRFGFVHLALGRARMGLGDSAGLADLKLSVKIREERLGTDNDQTAESLFWLAAATRDLGIAQESLEIRRANLGDSHPLTLKSELQVESIMSDSSSHGRPKTLGQLLAKLATSVLPRKHHSDDE
ncbi:Kinesin light chain 3 [Hondaea fermentalgiana]|uniref:Kinesin light chain 3 n=1 Tax=Hondaea fermentalgiana TaxID=2315210 RepID=A0A2R5GPM6_9STRA|nr:Kinesin light chain 3 [Hondaea fermentalgiana]|eukprot:GBG29834.1 Kinesin light chain 3 [Hondaea fermentalgiana]